MAKLFKNKLKFYDENTMANDRTALALTSKFGSLIKLIKRVVIGSNDTDDLLSLLKFL